MLSFEQVNGASLAIWQLCLKAGSQGGNCWRIERPVHSFNEASVTR